MYNFSTMVAKASLSLHACVCALLLQACSPALNPTLKPETTASSSASAPVGQTRVPTLEATVVPTATGTATLQPTLGPTATVWPPTYISWQLGDIRQLDSFVVTVN